MEQTPDRAVIDSAAETDPECGAVVRRNTIDGQLYPCEVRKSDAIHGSVEDCSRSLGFACMAPEAHHAFAPFPDRIAPLEVTWWQAADGVVHAFPDASGFARSVCKRERWTVKVVAPADDAEHCPDCSLLVNGAPGEIVEAYGR